MKNRSMYEVMAAILESVGKESTQTKIMYKAMVSGTQFRTYFDWLIRSGLVKEEDGNSRKLYRLTPKGIRFLAYYNELKQLFPGPIEENLLAEHYHIAKRTSHA